MRLEVIENSLINEKLYRKEYDNGLMAFILPKQGYNKKYAIFATNYGSIDSNFEVEGKTENVPDGIAHFLEHKLFEQKDGSVMDKFSILGASPNAYTSFNHTAYLFSTTDNFEKCFDLLLNYVQNPYLTDENVDKEKGIIGQEIRMYQDNPSWQVFFDLLGGLYVNLPVKIDIAGTIESIAKINKEILYTCHDTFYDPSNMVIFVVGEVDPQSIFETIEKNVKIDGPKKQINRIYPEEPTNINKQTVDKKLDVAIPLFSVGFKNVQIPKEPQEIIRTDIAQRIILELLAGKSSKLYKDMYEQGAITGSFDTDSTLENLYGFASIGAESPKPEFVYQNILSSIEEMKKNNINEENFLRAKKQFTGEFIRLFNSVDRIAHVFISNYFRGVNILDYINAYKDIKKEYVYDVLVNTFKQENAVMSIVNPAKS